LVSTGLTTAGRAAEVRDPASAVRRLAVADPVPPLIPVGAVESGAAVVSVRPVLSSAGTVASSVRFPPSRAISIGFGWARSTAKVSIDCRSVPANRVTTRVAVLPIGRPITGSIQFRNPDTQLASDPLPFEARDQQVDEFNIKRKLTTPTGQEIDLFKDLVSDKGQLEVVVKCLEHSQYFGFAQALADMAIHLIFHNVVQQFRILDSPGLRPYGPRGLGAADLSRSQPKLRVSTAMADDTRKDGEHDEDPGHDRDQRARRMCERLAERLELTGHQRARARDRRIFRDAVRRRFGAVRGAERVVDVDVAELRHLACERVVVGLFSLVEAAILQQNDVAGFERRMPRTSIDPVLDKGHGHSE
jgi:hypothetical protein